MGRPNAGWKLRTQPGSAVYSVRFVHAGKRVERTTGERDRARAAQEAAAIYARVVTGGAADTDRARLEQSETFPRGAALWLAATEAERDKRTNETYRGYVTAHLGKFFPSIASVTTARAREYANARLTQVTRSTVLKELSVLRQIVTWRLGDAAPKIADPPRRATGTAHPMGRRGKPPDLSALEILRVIRRVPRGQARRYFLVLWETGLRPETVKLLSSPENFVPGRRRLWIGAEQDKARADRWIPITPLAEIALTHALPSLFGAIGQRRKLLRRAAKDVLPPDKVRLLTTYHLRGARITYWLEQTHNVAGVMQLVGHVRLETTAKYVRPSERAAELVLGRTSPKRR